MVAHGAGDTLEGPGYAGYTSPQAEAMLGYPLDAWDADPLFWTKLLHPDDKERVLTENTRANAAGEPLVLEYRMISRDDRVVWLHDESVVLRDETGQIRYRQGVLLDITKHKEAEKALREAEVGYRTLVEQIPAITYIDRADGSDEPLYTSPQIEEMLGYTPEEWLEGRLWPERLHPDDKERVLAADERFEAGGERFSEEYRLIAKDGSVVWYARIWRMNADGSAKTNLTNTSLSWEFAPAWSPNGRQIAYWRPEEVGEIWAMYANGTGQRNITNNTAVSSSQAPDWQAIP